MPTNLTARSYSLLSFVICLLFIVGCKKSASDNTAVDPDSAARVSGRYTFQTITDVGSSGSKPTTVTNGTIIIVRTGTAIDMADLTLSYTAAGSSGSQSFVETKTLILKASGNNIDLNSGSSTVGTWTATQLTLSGYPFNGTLISLTATK